MQTPIDSAGNSTDLTRRDFIRGTSVAAMMAMMGGVPLIAQTAPTAGDEEDKPKVKCALIGLGVWGRDLLDQLTRLPNAELVAICDNYSAMLRRSSSRAPGAKQLSDYREVLDDKEIPAVIIATPTHQHREIAVAALKAGKHVYCEAPLAHTVEDARAIAQAAHAAPGQVFQAGLQMRSDPQRLFLLPFVRSGALGRPVQARSQWNKKQSWRVASPNPEREKAANWRLDAEVSTGLAGESGIHILDQTGWFWNTAPVAVTGFGAIRLWNDGRTVPDTVQLVVDYPDGVRSLFTATLASSFDADHELLYGSDATVMMRDNKAWMFKEVDSPLLGWEVYARRDNFYKETGIALIAGGSKQDALSDKAADASPFPFPSHYYALEAFLGNCDEISAAVEDFKSNFEDADAETLRDYLSSIKLRPAADYREGYAATVLALKANEAVSRGARIELPAQLFELA